MTQKKQEQKYTKYMRSDCIFHALENVRKRERKSQLIKTKLKELRFMEIQPKEQTLGHDCFILDITCGRFMPISKIVSRMMTIYMCLEIECVALF